MVTIQLDNLKHEWSTKLREKDYEIQRLNEKLKRREYEQEMNKLNTKIDKLKIKIREVRINYVANEMLLFALLMLFACLWKSDLTVATEEKKCSL